MKRISFIVLILIPTLVLLNCSNTNDAKIYKSKNNDPTKIDLYRLKVAYQINKNWKFKQRISSDTNPIVKISFKVMPDGEIRDIKYIEKSEYSNLDKSAYLAIQNTNPTEPFPKEIKKPYVEMGIQFTLDGIK